MGDEELPSIYGMEFPSRSLAVELAPNEKEVTRFMVGTQTMKFQNNQIHIIEVNDENAGLNSQVYSHPAGELWYLHWSPHNSTNLSSVYLAIDDEGVYTQCSLWRIPSNSQDLEQLFCFKHRNAKMSQFHPTDKEKFMLVCEDKLLVYDLGDGPPKEAYKCSIDQKGHSKISGGKWNPHESGAHFSSYQDFNVKGWDLRSPAPTWSIDHANTHFTRDIDYNRNRCHTLASCGDDCEINIWDVRNVSNQMKTLSGHSHWVWTVRYNNLQDELLLTCSSDAHVKLWWAGSVAAEPNDKYKDGLLVNFSEHDESVYRIEWSNVDPWMFAALSYEGRLQIYRVPRKHKYNILDIS